MQHNISPISIVIPTLNEDRYLPVLLESIRKIAAPLEILVADGNSEDSTCEVVERFKPLFPNGSLILITSERGISRQRNAGGMLAKYPTIVFCDADVVMPPSEQYIALISEFESKGYVVAAPHVIPIERTAGTIFVYIALKLFQKTLLLFGQPYFAGSFLVTSSDIFKKVGGFDEEVLLAEDVDYSFRASTHGKYGLLNTVPVQVSARRFLKYGTANALWEWIKAAAILIIGGRVTPTNVYYPLGDFNKPN